MNIGGPFTERMAKMRSNNIFFFVNFGILNLRYASSAIKAGCSAVVEFFLGDYAIASIKQDPYMKFLGGFITYDGKRLPKLIYKKIKLGLENIESCLVWDEHL
jgi:hypothetical protein